MARPVHRVEDNTQTDQGIALCKHLQKNKLLTATQCCSCHATQQDGVLSGRSTQPSTESCWANQHETQHETPIAYSWGRQSQLCRKLGPFIMAPVNHSPARNKKTTTALLPMGLIVRPRTMLCQVCMYFILSGTYNARSYLCPIYVGISVPLYILGLRHPAALWSVLRDGNSASYGRCT